MKKFNEILIKTTQEFDTKLKRWIIVKHYICY
jgi:hypothetical protein